MNINKPTQKEIEEVIKQLKELKPKVRQKTFFGDDNRIAIDAQIMVLENKMNEDAIWDEWPDEDHTRDAALEVLEWLDGNIESLVDDWLLLIVE